MLWSNSVRGLGTDGEGSRRDCTIGPAWGGLLVTAPWAREQEGRASTVSVWSLAAGFGGELLNYRVGFTGVAREELLVPRERFIGLS